MKKFLVAAAAFGLVAGVAASASALELKVDGKYQADGFYINSGFGIFGVAPWDISINLGALAASELARTLSVAGLLGKQWPAAILARIWQDAAAYGAHSFEPQERTDARHPRDPR